MGRFNILALVLVHTVSGICTFSWSFVPTWAVRRFRFLRKTIREIPLVLEFESSNDASNEFTTYIHPGAPLPLFYYLTDFKLYNTAIAPATTAPKTPAGATRAPALVDCWRGADYKSVSHTSQKRKASLTLVTLTVAFPLATGAPVIELATPTERLALADADAGVVAGAADPDAAPEELLEACTAGPTSLCFPANGSVGNPQLAPAPLKVLPYMRQML